MIATDRLDNRSLQRVFPIFSDESVTLANYALSTARGSALDIGTGSGVLAILAARRGADSVTAVDINPRALRLARWNAGLAGVSERVQFLMGDTYAPVRGMRFDLIMANPPFVALPPGCPFHIAGDGGSDGVKVIRKILLGAGDALSSGGTFVMTALSLERDGRPYVLELAERLLPAYLKVEVFPVYPESVSLRCYCELFKGCEEYVAWVGRLRCRGFDSVSYLILRASSGAASPRSGRPEAPERTEFAGGWTERLARYRFWLSLNKT